MSGITSMLNVAEREKLFAKKLKEKDSTKEYVSGFKDVDSRCYIKCLKCNNVYSINATAIRNKAKHIRCLNCERIARGKRKQEQIRQHTIDSLERKANNLLNNIQIHFSQCKHCGEYFVGDNLYCSKRCRARKNEHIKSRKRIEKAKANGSIDIDITLDKLIKRDNNICYLCGKECNLNDYEYKGSTFIAGNNYPSIEHIIPLSLGGTHTWKNVKLAHRICNTLKGNKI